MQPCHVMTGAIGFQSGILRALTCTLINPAIHPPLEGRGLLANKVKAIMKTVFDSVIRIS
jgi:hypothetical protein